MPYAGRPALPPLHLEELARQRQHQRNAVLARTDLAPPCQDGWLRPMRDPPGVLEPTHGQHASVHEVGSDDRPNSGRGQVISLAPRSGYPSTDCLDLPRSVSPGLTPHGSPRSTHTVAAANPAPALSPPPTAATLARPPIPERNHSVPSVSNTSVRLGSAPHRAAAPVAAPTPKADPFRDDPVASDINKGLNALRLLRAQELSDYETHDRQQLIDSHEIQKLMASLRSWGKECELQNYPGSPRPLGFVGAAPSATMLFELEAANEGRLRQFKLALARGSLASFDGQNEPRSPQYESRNPYSPPLSRQSSTSSRHGSLFRFSSIRKGSEPGSGRSSLSGDSLFSRDSMGSYISASSAASAAFLNPAEGVLTPNMIDPLIVDLNSILANEWNIDQCLLSLPSLLLRLGVLDTWLYGLRLRRKRLSEHC